MLEPQMELTDEQLSVVEELFRREAASRAGGRPQPAPPAWKALPGWFGAIPDKRSFKNQIRHNRPAGADY